MRRLSLSFAALVAVASLACAPGLTVDPATDTSYGLNVVNEMPHAMIVSLDDGTATRRLGTVGPNRQEQFVITGAERTTVSVVAVDEAETHTVRRTVTLVPGGTVEVRLN